MNRAAALLPAFTLLLTSACTTGKDVYPSLARRDVERVAATPPAPPPPASAPAADPSLSGNLVRLIDQARSAHSLFNNRRSRAEQAASGLRGAAGNDSWANAQLALADLESARSQTMVPLADLDALWTEARIAGADAVSIGAARDQVMAMVAEEDAVLARLSRR